MKAKIALILIIILLALVFLANFKFLEKSAELKPEENKTGAGINISTNLSYYRNESGKEIEKEIRAGKSIYINATRRVPENGFFAGIITYNLSKAGKLILHDTLKNRTWIIDADKAYGRAGIVFQVGNKSKKGRLIITAKDDNIQEEFDYEIAGNLTQEANAFIIEAWALMHRELTETLKVNDSAGVAIEDAKKSFTIIITERDLKVESGLRKPDIIFVIRREEDLKEFAAGENVGKTLRKMLNERKLAIKLKTGDMMKLSRYLELAVRLGVV